MLYPVKQIYYQLIHEAISFIEPEPGILPYIITETLGFRKKMQLYYFNKNKDRYNNDFGTMIQPDYISHHFKEIQEKNGIEPIRFHDLRHTCASLLHSFGHSVKEIQEYLGHGQISTTLDIYTHLFQEDKMGICESINENFSRLR